MPRTGVWRAGSLLLAALLTGCGESEIAEPGTQDGGARDTTTISADAVARLRQGHYADVRDLAQAVSLPTAFARAEALHALAARSEEAGLKALLDEAAEIADPADRHLARQVLYLRYAELDAAGALVSRAPEDAMAVYNRVPEEDRSPQLVERMVKSMMRTDSRRTEQWLESLSDPAMRDTGFLNMAARTSDLDRSLDYVRRISGERMRVRAAVALLMRNRRDPDSVDRILGDADLPPSVVTQLREEMRRRFPMGVTR